MAHVLIMPRQGNTVESCIITDWKVSEGEAVRAETAVCEVETDKASFEIPAGEAGTVLKILHSAGDDVPVLKPIAIIGTAGEDWQKVLGNVECGMRNEESTSQPSPSPAAVTDSKTSSPVITPHSSFLIPHSSFPTPHSPLHVSPRARLLAEKEALPLPAIGTGPGGRIIERDVIAAREERPALTVAARAAGASFDQIPRVGSGLAGRVTAGDLSAAQISPLPTPHSPFPKEGAVTETPLKGIRKIISDRMHASLAESAQFTLSAYASAEKMQEFRGRIKSSGEFAETAGPGKVTINDLILFAISRTLPRFPYMNAHKTGDVIKTFERVHLAIAVDTPKGLMVPVIRNANLLSLKEISSEAKRLAAACLAGTARPEELSGSTFTISNLGSLGVASFTPVLNAPEVGILGVAGIEMKAVALPEGEDRGGCSCGCAAVRFEAQIGFSLTVNHQAVDGAPAARFLKALSEAVANIDLLLAAG